MCNTTRRVELDESILGEAARESSEAIDHGHTNSSTQQDAAHRESATSDCRVRW